MPVSRPPVLFGAGPAIGNDVGGSVAGGTETPAG